MPIERWRKCLSVTFLVVLAAPTGGCANSLSKRAAHPQPVDMRLLEFLGSADPTGNEKHSGGAGWMVFLSELNMGKAADIKAEHASTPARKRADDPCTSGAGRR